MATAKKKTKKAPAKSTPTARNTTVKKTSSKKAAKKKAITRTVKKKAGSKRPAKKIQPKSGQQDSKIKVNPEQHHKMICEAAYFISLNKTQETVNPTEDWLQAEAAINKIYVVVNR